MSSPTPSPTRYLNSSPLAVKFWGWCNDLTSWQELQLIIQNIGSAQDEMPTRVSQANGREAGRQTGRKSIVIKLVLVHSSQAQSIQERYRQKLPRVEQ